MTIDVITPDRQLEKFKSADVSVTGWDSPRPGHIDIGLSTAGEHRYSFLLDKRDFELLLREADKLGWVPTAKGGAND